MNVLEEIITMVGTGYTDTNLIVGSTLKAVMFKVVADLNENCKLLGVDVIDYMGPVTQYPYKFYHDAWNLIIRPSVAEYLIKNMPNSWFIGFYTFDLKPN